MQRACAILSTVVRPALHYFYTLSLKRQDFRKGVIVHKNVFSFYQQLLSETFLTVSEDNDGSIYWSYYTLFLCGFKEN